jgi:chloride channel 3/4/5
MLVKISLSIITIGATIPSGILYLKLTSVPSMIWGALFGRILGEIVHIVHENYRWLAIFSSCPPEGSCVTPGMYSLLGAMGALGGVTKLTVSLTVIMFELTGTLNYIVPCMVTLATAKLVSDQFEQVGIVEILIRRKGFPYLDPRLDETILGTAGEKMTAIQDLVCLTNDGMQVFEIDQILRETQFQGYPIISSRQNANIIGYINRSDLVSGISTFS